MNNSVLLTVGLVQDPGGGALPNNGLLGMCGWMGSHFHDWTDYNGVGLSACIFNRVTRMGSHLVFLEQEKLFV